MLEFRTLCLSDIHLGTKSCKAEYLLDFLNHIHCQTLYLVGDVFDLERMRNGGWYWPEIHHQVLLSILALAREGTEVVYIPGNHDELLRDYVGTEFKGIRLQMREIHENADGRRFLILHGDEYDTFVSSGSWSSMLGCLTYDGLVEINRWVNLTRRRFGLPYWSFASFLKQRIGNARRYIEKFENTLLEDALNQGLDGIVCGHIHHPALKQCDGLMYGNCGDWVENCTALVEDFDGGWRLIRWAEESARLLDLGQDYNEMEPEVSVI